jgi:SAM-dependent methyltransferase
MIPFVKKVLLRATGANRSICVEGTIPKQLTTTQQMFLRWNAERLNISFQESQRRYFSSWSAIRDGHGGSSYRLLCDLYYNLVQVLFSDARDEVYAAYEFYGPIHFLRMLSYPEPEWNQDDPIIRHLANYTTVDIMDYGCGLAQQSRALARCLKEKGLGVSLTLIDIPTIRKPFLLWLGEQADIRTTFLDAKSAEPVVALPSCDICFVTEFFEHVYQPIRYFDGIHRALKKNGLLVTNIADHRREFMHVSPDLKTIRDAIQKLGYDEISPNTIYSKRSDIS